MKKSTKRRSQEQRVTMAKINIPCIFNPNKARPFDGIFFRVKGVEGEWGSICFTFIFQE